MAPPRLPKDIPPDLLEQARARFREFPLTRDWRLTVDRLGPGQAVMGLEPSLITSGSAGVVTGGVLATLADLACALALCTRFDGRMPFATSDLHIRYLEPATSRVAAEASVLRAGLHSAVLECRMRCDGRIVALCTAHFTLKREPGDDK